MLPLPVLEHLKWLQRTDNVHRVHCSLLADLWTGGNKKTMLNLYGLYRDVTVKMPINVPSCGRANLSYLWWRSLCPWSCTCTAAELPSNSCDNWLGPNPIEGAQENQPSLQPSTAGNLEPCQTKNVMHVSRNNSIQR